MLFELDFVHNDLYCCVKYLNVEYQVEIFKTIIKRYAHNQWVEYGFGRRSSQFEERSALELLSGSSH